MFHTTESISNLIMKFDTIDKNLEFENFLTGYNQKLDINVVELKKLHENQNLDFANLFFKNQLSFLNMKNQ